VDTRHNRLKNTTLPTEWEVSFVDRIFAETNNRNRLVNTLRSSGLSSTTKIDWCIFSAILYELQDFGPSDAVERFRDIEARKKSQLATSNDEADIRTLIERWAKAVREENRADIRADHDHAILMFDVPPPFLSRGLDAYMATWETFFSSAEKPVAFAFHDVQVTCGQDVSFATAVGRCVNIDMNGKREPLEFRLTMGLRKLDGRWRVMHEHHSLPAT
jgi:ketosteroid isomerase-like protein